MAEKPKRTKTCPKCSHELDINRGVCPECGYMFPWFQIRLAVGGCSVVLAFLGLLAMAIMSIFGK